ncbi:segregation and condensation protein A [Pectinatus brassicae]|uniref:Segregation and condensation protein A n=1 Tax=Pectinatus brassicae TaxID=862415 RepID=A0A840ULR7_9FIRM|nr:segregation/condensation protein A [Pectinatus brassicae]MBB5336727.1 segregation and condensation protein A [Pectinatus brassicae]
MSEEYKVRLKAFEGPLDLLLHLIEKNKIDIYDIPIAVLTEQYLDYLKQFREFNIEVASEFLIMAATLLQIKSRILLPAEEKAEDDEIDLEDPRQELVDRLIEYRRFKEVSNILNELEESQAHLFYRESILPPVQHLPPQGLDIKVLWEAFQNVLEGQLSQKVIQKVSKDKFSVQDKMLVILSLLQNSVDYMILFSEVFSNINNRPELIASFLALLELIKLNRIDIKQNYSFSPIYIYLRNEE